MARRSDTSAAPRKPLSRDRVLRAAVRLADKNGIESLSMRRLAKELGVEAMSLYNHVANKDEILAGMIDLVSGEIEMPSDEADWKAAVRRSAISLRDVLLRHRWAASIWMSSHSGGPSHLRRADWLLRTLREAGLSKELTYHAYHVIEAYVLGYTLQQLSFPYKMEELAGLAANFLRRLPADEYPDFVEHVMQHMEPHGDESGFEVGLDLILAGLEQA
jgi:AcrR family transcriptional regulator